MLALGVCSGKANMYVRPGMKDLDMEEDTKNKFLIIFVGHQKKKK